MPKSRQSKLNNFSYFLLGVGASLLAQSLADAFTAPAPSFPEPQPHPEALRAIRPKGRSLAEFNGMPPRRKRKKGPTGRRHGRTLAELKALKNRRLWAIPAEA